MNKKQVSVSIPQNYYEELEGIRKELGLTRNAVIMIAISQYLDTKKVASNYEAMAEIMQNKFKEQLDDMNIEFTKVTQQK